MGMRNLPTKNNLIKLKSFINQSKEGKKLLEQKKLILQREMDKYIKERKELKKRGENLLKEAFESLKNANVDIGIERVADIANGIEKDDSLDIKYISVMGVEIPSVVIGEKEQKINFGLYEATVAMDEAIVKFQEVKEYLVNFAQIETTITRLKASIEKVERRINALEQVIIPRDEKIAKKISDILDETEMEEFARLRIVKKDKKE